MRGPWNVEPQAGDVRGGDLNRRGAPGLSLHAGLAPVLTESLDREPGVPGIAKRIGRKIDLCRRGRPSFGCLGCDKRLDRRQGVGMNLVARLRPDDVRNGESAFLAGGLHHVGSLLLAIDFAAVGDRGEMPQVVRPVGAVVPMEQRPLRLSGSEIFLLKPAKKRDRFTESGTGRGGQPRARIVHRELPAARAAHGEPADRDPVVVDRQQRFYVRDRLQHVDFASELEGVAVAAVGMEHDRVSRDDRARIIEPLVKELHLTDLLAPTV